MFEDRFDAAQQMVPYLEKYRNNPDAIILAVPRGGLELGYVLAKELYLPLDIILTKKIGYPGNPEYAIGAVSLTNMLISPEFEDMPILQDYIEQQVKQIRSLLQERNIEYRNNKPALDITNKIIILVDDGVATGYTLLATLALLAQNHPQKIVVALPVAPPQVLERLRQEADEVICLEVPQIFFSVGQFYKKFEQVDDEEAIRLLHEANT